MSEIVPVCVTVCPDANDQLLYFTSTSLLADDRHLVVISDRTGHPNLFCVDMETRRERQLTFGAQGFLKSYVYFDGRPYEGFGRASVSLHPQSGTVYYIQGREIRAVDMQGNMRVLAEYPAGQMTAFTHVSTDGTRLCVPTTDERALDGGAWTQYGHFTVGNPNGFVSDGYYRQEDDLSQRAGVWITLQYVDWKAGKMEWIPLCRHGSSWDSQDSHPHPIYNHAADAVYFTSDKDGKRAVYRVDVPK